MPDSDRMERTDFGTLNELFLKAAENHPKPDAFLSKSGGRYQALSSLDALRQVATLAVALYRLGIRRGDRVAILSENRVEWALTDYATLGLGGIVVPIYPTLLEPDLEYILRDSGSKGIVLSTESQLRKILNVRSQLRDLLFILIMDWAPVGGPALSWHELVHDELQPRLDPVNFFHAQALEIKPEETASILYTSGTTGKPKGVLLTHANIVSNVQACAGLYPRGRDDVVISFLPLSHIFERMFDYHYFSLGVSIAYAESLEALAQNLLEVRPTAIAVVPRVLEKIYERVMETVSQAPLWKQSLFHWALEVGRLYSRYSLQHRAPPLVLRLKHAIADALVCSKVRSRLGGRMRVLFSGSATLARELAEFFYAMGLPVYEGYGLTETSPVIAVNTPGSVKLGTVGRAVRDVEIRLADAGVDQDGLSGREILVRGPNVTPGYYHMEEENREAFENGWFRTGDLGTLDPDGFLTITGRKKNLFKTSGGKYVSPEKLENLFQGHPYISQVIAVGENRRFVSALVVPNFARLETYAGSHGIPFRDREELVANREIHSFLQQQVNELTRWLPPHEKIRRIAVLPKEFSVDSGELSATQKVKRRVVEEHYRSLIEEIYQRHAPESRGRG